MPLFDFFFSFSHNKCRDGCYIRKLPKIKILKVKVYSIYRIMCILPCFPTNYTQARIFTNFSKKDIT